MAAAHVPDTGSADITHSQRARLVCFRCHGKKIKCDLVQQPGPELGPCRNCVKARAPCQLRSSKRGLGKRQSQANHHISTPSALPTGGNELNDLDSDTIHVASTNHQNHITSPYQPSYPSPQTTRSHHSLSTSIETSRPQTSFSAGVSRQDLNPLTVISPHSNQVHAALSIGSLASQQLPAQATCFGSAGYMQIFSQDNVVDEDQVQPRQLPADPTNVDAISPALQGVFLETYFEYCFVWCPVLDHDFLQRQPEVIESPLLRQALALCGNRINPPLIQYKESMVYYNRAKELFYGNYEGNPLVRLAAITLFFWWSVGASNLLNVDNAWWWTGIAIRIAQESGLHRELQPHQLLPLDETIGLRRRIWWTLFARDRILSISQGRPTIIDPDYCDVKMVTPQDFPDPTNPKVEIFINWVKLVEISGRMSKQLSRRVEDRTGTIQFSRDLISWIQSMPPTLSLPISTARTPAFDRDVHRLYLTYLTNVTLLHLSKSLQLLPKASRAAIIAASCVARLFGDYLARGNIRFLPGDAGWEITVAMLALLHARRVGDLRAHAEADIRTLRTALKQMALLWPSSRMFASAFDKLLGVDPINFNIMSNSAVGIEESEEDDEMLNPNNGAADWLGYFPFVTEQTSPLISVILARNMAMPFLGLDWPMDINAGLQEFMSLPDGLSFDIYNL